MFWILAGRTYIDALVDAPLAERKEGSNPWEPEMTEVGPTDVKNGASAVRTEADDAKFPLVIFSHG